MLQPREADIPALLLFFVVLPLVTYFLLGKCNEASKKKARVSVLAQLAAEEALTVEAMAAVDVVPVASLSTFGLHVCARCFGPATTRCSRCKSVRYCSGKCQIIHWRQGHKQECQKWKNDSPNVPASPTPIIEAGHRVASADMQVNSTFYQNDGKEFVHNVDASDLTNDPTASLFHGSTVETETPFNQDSHKIKKELSRREGDASCCLEEANSCVPTPSLHASTEFAELPSNEAPKRYKSGNNNTYIASDSICINRNNTSQTTGHSSTNPRNFTYETHNLRVQDRSLLESSIPRETASVCPERSMLSGCKTETGFSPEKVRSPGLEFSSTGGLGLNYSTDKLSAKGGTKFRRPPYTIGSNSVSHKPPTKPSRDNNSLSGVERKACREKESYGLPAATTGPIPVQDINGISKIMEKKLPGAKTSQKPPKHGTGTNSSDSLRKSKVLFPYEDLVKFFQCEMSDVYPRGLLNCGNSCYANAVLQCLTSTKPLLVYLLRGIHSRSCYVRDWCLMCELELHVSMLLEAGGPLSPSKVLSNMKNIGCRMGGGNQEDAHEFLRLLVMSMQSICLEGLGGEKEVDPRMQETTLIQQIFGGRLRSKVKCLRCESESERYENIMDLTLEIHGWVESLQDALTQFTAAEDLDGDNMYRCGRCCAYVKARKQLSVHEVPNILTIVLKRFQTGKYGKINKCVTFPDMLDMIPFMTGTSDSPPLYMLYAVVVHLDTLNASFSGHYVSYIKDLQGNWFRIDDTEVQAVSLGQVMSEGAYMLFYARSFPRPPRIYSGKTTTTQAPNAAKNSISKSPKPLRHGSTKTNEMLSAADTSPTLGVEVRPDMKAFSGERESNYLVKNVGRNMLPKHGTVPGSAGIDISDSSSSDWSLFTSSDESSFTTESTSDSFSTVDYSDGANTDPISSLFSPVYVPEYSHKSTILCRDFSQCRPKTRFFSESKSFVLDSSLGGVRKGKNLEDLISGKNCSMYAKIRERSQRYL